MEIRDATLNLTLGEIKTRDRDNLDLVIKESKQYVFDNKGAGQRFMGEITNKALKKLGVDQVAIISRNNGNKERMAEEINKAMKENDVRVEKREYGMRALKLLQKASHYDMMADATKMDPEKREVFKGTAEGYRQMVKATGEKIEDIWRTGLYIYHHNEIAFFISYPLATAGAKYKDTHIIIPNEKRYVVTTNYRDSIRLH